MKTSASQLRQTQTPNQRGSNGTGSCGCLRDEKIAALTRLPEGEAAFNAAYSSYRGAARERDIVFDISKEKFRELITQNCFYCGSPLVFYNDGPSRNGRFKRNGLDRMDNTKGYTEDNIVPCCKRCNIMKKAMDIGEFLGHIADIARKHSLIEK